MKCWLSSMSNIAVERDAPQAGFARPLRAPHLKRWTKPRKVIRARLPGFFGVATSAQSSGAEMRSGGFVTLVAER
jgi:hypothetical protein